MGIMSLTEIMDKSIETLKRYIKTIVTFNLAYGALCFIGIIGAIIVGAILMVIALGLKLNHVVLGIFSFILGIGIFTFVMSFKIGLIKISSQEFLEGRIYASQAIGVSFKNFFVVLGVLLMEMILFLPIFGVFAAIGYVFYNGFQQPLLWFGMYDNYEISTIILMIIFAILLILSVLAYITIFSFSFHAVAIENKGVFAALKRSYNLVKGDYFKIFGCIILFNLSVYAIVYSLQSFFGVVASVVFMILKFLNIQQDLLSFATMAYNYSSWPISILSWLVISPLGTIMLTYLYYNQRFKKEGYDITLRLNKIQKCEEKEQLCESTQYNNSI
ncbi:hypothetical protein G9F72_012905 [Clostridium estertheticum]|uniref:hypothetical protein n=1 Tax=Clostridium estertheticum TaxID=238834 RepID=UPI0013E956C3|nr:hypothetical protein [Clostridium estertheticum]MBZ9687225.1 hypothetical protein [Clostridium estertheticum]